MNNQASTHSRWAGACQSSRDTLDLPSIVEACLTAICSRSLLCIVSRGSSHKSGCYPSKTIGRDCNKTYTWNRCIRTHEFCNFKYRLEEKFTHTYHTPTLLVWTVMTLVERVCSLFCRQSMHLCIWNTSNRQVCTVQTFTGHPWSLLKDLWDPDLCLNLRISPFPKPFWRLQLQMHWFWSFPDGWRDNEAHQSYCFCIEGNMWTGRLFWVKANADEESLVCTKHGICGDKLIERLVLIPDRQNNIWNRDQSWSDLQLVPCFCPQLLCSWFRCT